MKRIDYDVIRETLQTGDVILFKGRHLRDKLLMLFTPYSHVSCVIRMPFQEMTNRVCVIETQFPGAQFRALSGEMAVHGKTYLIRSRLSMRQQDNIRGYLFDAVAKGLPYDVPGLFKSAFRKIPFNKERMYCSALIADALNHVGRLQVVTVPFPGEFPAIMEEEMVEIVL